ncbi:MAG: ribonuclease HII [Candidatus Cloacimonadota bacterium]|nr:MAG: ribonuclease HII [Candidatus Cloacimonadota bacterium]PIE81110.1 MAG: ribonuclease HII [Candidatus Delongbacteria bacterium]
MDSSILKNLVNFDKSLIENDKFILCGCDESGRGPLAGPVVAACVVLDYNNLPENINDSKKMSEKAREKAFYEIRKRAIAYSVSLVDHNRIDEINILQANFEAMNKAYSKLGIKPDLVLIDGRDAPIKNQKQIALIKGDSKSATVAAASIIAKVVRDKVMRFYHNYYPEYGFDSHKGYGTKKHVETIKRIGRSPIHRKSFKLQFEKDEQLLIKFPD